MEAIIVQKSPYAIEVESGSSYYWCSCGKSANQPFCDGSHKDSTFVPVKFEAEDTKTVYFCGCKHSSTKPFWDGSHSKLWIKKYWLGDLRSSKPIPTYAFIRLNQ